MRSTGCAIPYESRWSAVIGAFQSSLFRCEVVSWEVRYEVVPSAIRWCTGLLLCFLMADIHASGISIPLSLLMLSGWSLMWIASLTPRVYQCESRSINFTSFQSGRWPLLFPGPLGKQLHSGQWLKRTNHSRPSWFIWWRATSRPHRLMKTSSKQSKRRDLQLKWLHRETNDIHFII